VSVPKSVHRSLPDVKPKTSGFDRHAVRGDGSDDYMSVPDDATLHIDGKSFSVLLFFRHDISEGEDWFFNKGDTSGTDQILHFGMDSPDALAVDFYGDAVSITYGDKEEGIWYAAAVTLDAGTLDRHLYWMTRGDGLLHNSDTASGALSTTDGVDLLMHERWVGDNFHGSISEVMFYVGRVLTRSEVLYNMLNYHHPLRDNLAGWWRMEEGIGTTVHDFSGNGNDGTMNNYTGEYGWVNVKKWELRSEVGL